MSLSTVSIHLTRNNVLHFDYFSLELKSYQNACSNQNSTVDFPKAELRITTCHTQLHSRPRPI